jgi:hypothetical protein
LTTDQSLNASFPVIPHELLGVDCCGCIVVRAGENAELRSNQCDALVGVIAIEILKPSWEWEPCESPARVWSRKHLRQASARSSLPVANCDAVIETKNKIAKLQ